MINREVRPSRTQMRKQLVKKKISGQWGNEQVSVVEEQKLVKKNQVVSAVTSFLMLTVAVLFILMMIIGFVLTVTQP
ncbi:hypothetical protein [Limosilactobacillus oris]|uniref:hypothetical protein n=1 Tax=Limosilactobacillus oris TaxID=1632 RepID=UPI0019572F52|nr:hypothetical protein [Limosilactobacillus oris]VTX69699.1 Uncharacterised protein [Limosilactobacillus oris]